MSNLRGVTEFMNAAPQVSSGRQIPDEGARPDGAAPDDDDVDGCLHGVPWGEPCAECEYDDERTWIECGYY